MHFTRFAISTGAGHDPRRPDQYAHEHGVEEHRNLTREQARAVVGEVFEAIKEALRNGEDVSLPVGNFEVCEQPRQPLRRWFLKRVRVTYKQRNMIKFKGDVYDIEPTDQPPDILDSEGEMKQSEIDSTPKISPAQRRKLVAIGIKAGKSRRLIARELNVTATTIARDLELLPRCCRMSICCAYPLDGLFDRLRSADF